MSEYQKLSIFWDESAIYLFVYAGYALLVCAIFCVVEMKLARNAGTALSRLALHNALLALLAVSLFALSLLVSGWYARLLGGELGAFLVSVAMTLFALYFFKTYSIGQLALGYGSALLAAVTAAALLAAPYTLGMLFIFLLAAGMRN